ncbi:curli production assembly/transport protein CsgG [Halomonas sp. 18H]|nr:CsgG/HfaB family protein [Halomonas sp. 18H]MCW4150314.1 curli production assembly/transport protein CsgG [Halomonas sp. 18H]
MKTCLDKMKICALLVLVSVLAGCATPIGSSPAEMFSGPPEVNSRTRSGDLLARLPPPQDKLAVAVYDFPDLSGQRKPKENVAELSTAVTQGGAQILNDTLLRAGGGSWFDVVERSGLQNILQERQIIRQQREVYMGAEAPPLTPLIFAGTVLEGGIVSYDTNITTGGFGARLLGIGGNTEYRTDVVEVVLRLVSVQTGKIVRSVNARKSILSVLLQGSAFKYIAADEILEAEAGVTSNEPTNIAVREAIEAAVYALIVESTIAGDFAFADPDEGEQVIAAYQARREAAD